MTTKEITEAIRDGKTVKSNCGRKVTLESNRAGAFIPNARPVFQWKQRRGVCETLINSEDASSCSIVDE